MHFNGNRITHRMGYRKCLSQVLIHQLDEWLSKWVIHCAGLAKKQFHLIGICYWSD